ncbi:TonB family protein [Terriglobus saanensis]|uniref:TonB family protein n=1 Tax=Terriglobus saanensis (strain ATCC BAA-1853 / DSM 23119 / SP1PR4) TaxID=401053 RepID=E8V4W9_TERSS|nr:TonB family protein [Terriglobus saanensis]ADV82597.1 TonB family protein [Terriglobus saanensis SP1PR4]
MRRAILPTLILLPLMGYAQSSVSTPSSNLQARLDAPSVASVSRTQTTPAIREYVAIHDVELTPRPASGLSYSFYNADVFQTNPQIIHSIAVPVSSQQITAKESSVAVRMTVDRAGVPRALVVAKSAGSELDGKALATLSQYRFKPATVNRVSVESELTLQVRIVKQ